MEQVTITIATGKISAKTFWTLSCPDLSFNKNPTFVQWLLSQIYFPFISIGSKKSWDTYIKIECVFVVLKSNSQEGKIKISTPTF